MKHDERGAVAVEFAILLPLLLMLVLGTIEFGRAYNARVTLTNAARDGVRVMAITTNNVVAAKTAAANAAASVSSSITPSNVTVEVCTSASSCAPVTACNPKDQVTLTISYTLSTITGIAGPFKMKGLGVMLCGG
ncbi:TadE/TadG family type IV pilus assembly protein [Pseudarthrobacter sulfonivorans]|uniref:TadE/TadG family type IV pilus assembly protein n=1 Tax=Pseudarthrobacter sulfonivorans TaxID=121292 RepID=UPI0021028365|nr:TadE/TadG family type IV pilus assembly protein [Pseudarthrobacter sulfonivorans]